MSEFQALLNEINALAQPPEPLVKAQPHPEPDEDNRGGPSDQDEDNRDEDDPDEDEDEDEDPPDDPKGSQRFGKSFGVTLPGGEQVQALDASAAIDALHAKLDGQGDGMFKALRSLTDLLKSQQTQLAALHQQVSTLSARPAGRKSVLNVHEKPSPVPEPAAEPTPPRAVLAKAMSAQKAGRLHAGQVAEIELYLGSGRPLPEHLARALD